MVVGKGGELYKDFSHNPHLWFSDTGSWQIVKIPYDSPDVAAKFHHGGAWGANYMDDFSKQKIVYPNMTKFMPFLYDKNNFITNQKCFIITGKNLAFLTAFFNSSLFKYCFRDNFPELQGGTRELSKIFFESIPIIQINSKIENEFSIKVLQIQTLISDNKESKKIETELDNMIFDLYQLTKEERETIGFIEIR